MSKNSNSGGNATATNTATLTTEPSVKASWFVAQPSGFLVKGPVFLSSLQDLQMFCTALCPCSGYQGFQTLQDATAFMQHLTQPQQQPTLQQPQQQTNTKQTQQQTNINNHVETIDLQPHRRKSTARAPRSATKRQKKGKQQQDDKDKDDENDKSSNHDNDPLYQEYSHLTPRLSSEETFHISFNKFLPIMQEWKEKHGTADVPQALRKIHGNIIVLANGKEVNTTDIPKGLPQFMGKLRNQLRLYKVSKTSSWLSPSQVAQVRALNLPIDTKPQVWNQKQFQALKQYCQQNPETTNILASIKFDDPQHRQMRLWINDVVHAYEDKQEGKFAPLSDRHVEQFAAIGFDLQQQERRNQTKSFDAQAAEWLAYRSTHGEDCPSDNQHPVRKWINRVRRQWYARQQDPTVKTSLLPAQWEKLEAWDFPFDTGYVRPLLPPAKPKTFEERVEELLAYKAEFGDTNVPQAFPSIGSWVSTQRYEYQKRLKGKKSTMTDERLQRLREISFLFAAPKANGPRFLKAEGKEARLKTRQLLAAKEELRQGKIAETLQQIRQCHHDEGSENNNVHGHDEDS